MRRRGGLLGLVVRGRPWIAWLPIGMLSTDAIDYLHIRSKGKLLRMGSSEGDHPTRETEVPAGWAALVAVETTRAALHTMRMWAGPVLVLVLAALLFFASATGWVLVAAPFLLLLNMVRVYLGTRRAVAAALPAGSVARTEFLEDRFVSRNAGGVREVRYDEISSVDVRGDVVLLRTTSGVLAVARVLFPDDVLGGLETPPSG